MKQLKLLFTVLFLAVLGLGNVWGADETVMCSFSRSGTTNSTTDGFTFSSAAAGQAGYYQDGSGTLRYLQLKKTSAMFTTAPSSITFEAKLGGGTTKDPLGNSVHACFVDKDGKDISGSEVVVTTKITTTTGSDFSVSMSTSYATQAYGVKLYHEKESGYNVRYYSFALKYTASSSTETTVKKVTLPATGEFVGSKSIELSCETAGAAIYYTLDGTDPTSASTLYNGAFTLTETTTVKAIAVKDGTNSEVASATYTKVAALTSMDEIFAAATTAGSTAASKVITFDNWVISGVKGKNAYLTDNNGKGLIIFQDGHGFAVGDILSGTATCKVQLYNGSAELTTLTSATTGLTVNKGGSATVKEIAVADLTGVNTGAVIKLENVSYTQDGTKFYFGDLQAYWNLMTAPTSMTVGAKYDVTGVYVQYNAVKEILPRTEADIEAAASDVTLTSIAISGTVTKNEYFVGDAFDKAGLVVTATYSDASTLDVTSSATWSFDPAALDNTSITTVNVTATFNEVSSAAYPVAVTVAPAPLKVTWDLSKDETASASADALSWTSDYATMNATKGSSAANNYYPGTEGKTYTSTRFYTNSVLTIAPVDGYAIDKVEFTATSNAYASTLQSSEWTNASAAVTTTLVTVTPTDGETAISAKIGGTCGFTSVVVYYHVGSTKYNVVENLNGCAAAAENAKKFVDGTDELTLKYTLTDGFVWPENITVKVGETTLSATDVDYMWTVEGVNGTLEIAYEMHDNLNITIAATAKELTGIAVKTAPEKVAYYVGDNFDPAGLVITATYNDASTADIAYADAAADFSFAPALDAALALADVNVAITYNGKTCNQAISVAKAPTKYVWDAREQGYVASTTVVSDITFGTGINGVFSKGEGSNDPKYYLGTSNKPETGAVRLYAKGTLTISALQGMSIEKVEFTFGNGEAAIPNTFTVSTGSYADGVWNKSAEGTDPVSEIILTEAGESGQRRIQTITVYYTGEPATPTGIALTTTDVQKEFYFGEEFNSNNLKVEALYGIEGADGKDDVTALAEVVAPDMTTSGEKTVTVNYLTFSANYTITVAEPVGVSSIELDNETLSIREDKTGKLTATVNPSDAYNKALTWTSNNEAVVKVDANGNLTPQGVGKTTITVASVSNPEVTATCVVTIIAKPALVSYNLVTDASTLEVGDVIILGCAAKEKVAGALGENSYLASVEAEFEEGVASAADAMEFILGKDGDNWTLTSTEGKLGLTAVKVLSTNEANTKYVGTWTIAISAEGVATIASTNTDFGTMKYNATSPRFTTYASGQTAIEIYVHPTKKHYTRELNDKMGTHCYPFTIKAGEYTGAHFYVPTYREGDVKIFWDEVAADEDIVAGKPYLVVPAEEGAKLEAVGNLVEGAAAQAINGFVGSFEKKLIEEAGNYIVYNNQFRLVAPNANVYVGANRAYIHLDGVSTNEVAPAPGRRRITLINTAANGTTALENISEEFGAEQVAKKVVVNGTIYVVRDAKVYTVDGQMLK